MSPASAACSPISTGSRLGEGVRQHDGGLRELPRRKATALTRLALRQGESPGPDSAHITEARRHLEDAVTYDPSNWIARFNLALTLCRDSQVDTALKHFDMLEEVVARAWPKAALLRRDQSESGCSTWPEIAGRQAGLLETIEGLCQQEQEQHWRSLQTSHAVVLMALAIYPACTRARELLVSLDHRVSPDTRSETANLHRHPALDYGTVRSPADAI
jgi:hypothetical protein